MSNTIAAIASRPAILTPTPMPACWPVVRPPEEESFVIGAVDGVAVDVVVGVDFKLDPVAVVPVAVEVELCEDVTLEVVVVVESPVILNE